MMNAMKTEREDREVKLLRDNKERQRVLYVSLLSLFLIQSAGARRLRKIFVQSIGTNSKDTKNS